MRVKLHVLPIDEIDLTTQEQGSIALHVEGGGGSTLPIYDGQYTVTPSQSAVVLATDGKQMINNVTINPIPNNYGLITWNGSILTVS